MRTELSLPSLGLPLRGAPVPLRLDLEQAGRVLSVRIVDVGLACCSVELMAAIAGSGSARAEGAIPSEPGADAEVLVIAGTCTDAMAPALRRIHASMPTGTRVVSFGACSNSGGPYWDSYSVTKGVDQLVPVDVYVPGCPPRPEALLQAIASLAEPL